MVVSDLKVTSTAASRSGVYGLVSCFEAENVRIRNLEISNSTSTAIYTISSKQLWIEGNYVHDQWADGIHISRGSEQVVISNNIIDHNGDEASASSPTTAPRSTTNIPATTRSWSAAT